MRETMAGCLITSPDREIAQDANYTTGGMLKITVDANYSIGGKVEIPRGANYSARGML